MNTLKLKIKTSNAVSGIALHSKALVSAGNPSWSFLQIYKIAAGDVHCHTQITEATSDAPSGNYLLLDEQTAGQLGFKDGQGVELSLSNTSKATFIQVESVEGKKSKAAQVHLISGLQVDVGKVYYYEQGAVRVKSCDPEDSYVNESTVIESITSEDGNNVSTSTTLGTKSGALAKDGFAALIGMDDVIDKVHKEILLPFHHPELAQKYMGSPLKGALLNGPYGIGKTALARAIASEANVELITVPIAIATSNKGPGSIAKLYEKAGKMKDGAIIFFDEIDAIAPRDSPFGSTVTTTIQECMDGYKRYPRVFTLAATNHLDNVAPSLLRGGRFDLMINLGMPDKNSRAKLFKHFTKDRLVRQPIDYGHLAGLSPAFSGADIESVVKQAGLEAFRMHIQNNENVSITQDAIENCLAKHKPTGERIMGVTTPNFSFKDMFGIDNLCREILPKLDLVSGKKIATYTEAKNLPILLYGPPGTGKTCFAEAIASYLKVSFVARTGGWFKNMFVGESERNVRELFNLARTYAPLVIFIDEIDALGSRRNGLNPFGDELLNEFLAEMQGVAGNDGVYIIGATNRLDMLDEALLSRFPCQFELPKPDEKEREQIIEGLFGKLPPEIVKINHAEIAKLTHGLSQRDIAGLVGTCRMNLDMNRVSILTTDYLKRLIGSHSSASIPENRLNGVSL